MRHWEEWGDEKYTSLDSTGGGVVGCVRKSEMLFDVSFLVSGGRSSGLRVGRLGQSEAQELNLWCLHRRSGAGWTGEK